MEDNIAHKIAGMIAGHVVVIGSHAPGIIPTHDHKLATKILNEMAQSIGMNTGLIPPKQTLLNRIHK